MTAAISCAATMSPACRRRRRARPWSGASARAAAALEQLVAGAIDRVAGDRARRRARRSRDRRGRAMNATIDRTPVTVTGRVATLRGTPSTRDQRPAERDLDDRGDRRSSPCRTARAMRSRSAFDTAAHDVGLEDVVERAGGDRRERSRRRADVAQQRASARRVPSADHVRFVAGASAATWRAAAEHHSAIALRPCIRRARARSCRRQVHRGAARRSGRRGCRRASRPCRCGRCGASRSGRRSAR